MCRTQLRLCWIVGLALAASRVQAKRVVCYYRWKHAGLHPDDLPQGCTHIAISFVTVTHDHNLNLSQVEHEDAIRGFVGSYRQKQPETKFLISVGGGGRSEGHFSRMAASRESRQKFLNATKLMLSFTELDGIDFDWEFPQYSERASLSSLLEETHLAFEHLGKITGKTYVIGIALPGPFTLISGFSATAINRYCTYASVMAYDLLLYDGFFVTQATLHSALNPQVFFLHPFAFYSVKSSMRAWTKIDKEKLNLGLPTYGVAYELCDANQTEHLSCIKGYSPLGANLNYTRICTMRKEYPENDRWHRQAEAPYIFDNHSNWVSYDNERSLALKVDYALKQNFGGLMIFSLNADDINGRCGRRFPLLNAVLDKWS